MGHGSSSVELCVMVLLGQKGAVGGAYSRWLLFRPRMCKLLMWWCDTVVSFIIFPTVVLIIFRNMLAKVDRKIQVSEANSQILGDEIGARQ